MGVDGSSLSVRIGCRRPWLNPWGGAGFYLATIRAIPQGRSRFIACLADMADATTIGPHANAAAGKAVEIYPPGGMDRAPVSRFARPVPRI